MIFIREHVKGEALTETTFLVLLSVYQPNHGYGIMQFIEKVTGGRVQLGAGTLYGAINTLAKKQWIAPVANADHGNKKEYLITELGKRVAERELQRLKELQRIATTIMGGASE